MKSALPKVLHELAGRPMLDWGLALAAELGCARTIVVTGKEADLVRARIEAAPGDTRSVIQHPPRGTGHAARQAEVELSDFDGDVIVFFADTPLIRAATLERMFAERDAGAGAVMLGFHAADPTGYGRILRDAAGIFARNVEHKDASEEERRETLCNAGALVADRKILFQLISMLRDDNAQGEFYLTDVPGLAKSAGMNVAIVEAEEAEVMGVNSRAQLAEAEAAFQSRARAAAMEAGVTLLDPSSVYFAYDTQIEPDVVIEPNVFFAKGVTIRRGARVHAFCHLIDTEIGESAAIGPFARFRPGTKLGPKTKVGNFVEIKNSTLAEGAKASHLTYIGDADVGARANIGCGTIVCNYDGFDKYRATIGEEAFIGSDTALVSPVKIGARAYTATGSVITKDVPDGALAVARGRQSNIEGWADKFRDKKRAEKAKKDAK